MIRACLILALATSAFAGYTGFGGYGLGYGLGYGGLGYAGYGLSHYGLAHGVGYSGLGLGYSYAPAAGVAVAAPAVAKTVSTYHAAPAVATVAHAAPVATYATAPIATYAAAPAVTSVVRSAPVVAAAPVATFAPAASYAVAAPAVTKTVSTYHAAPVATYAAAPAVTSVVRSAPVVAAAPVATYAAAPAVTRVATYHAAPVATAVAAPVATYAAAPAVAAVHAAPAVATTTVHHAPAVASYGVAHAAPVVASYGVAHAAPVYGYGVGHLGYGVGHYGFGHGLGAYGLNYGYGLGSPFDYTTLLRKKKWDRERKRVKRANTDSVATEKAAESRRNCVRTHKVTDWNAFRGSLPGETVVIEDIEQWTAGLMERAAAATREIETDASIERVDNRLAHLIEAKKALLTRWKAQRTNRKLRKKIAELNRVIEAHCTTLCAQRWHEIRSAADGQMHCGRTWTLLRHLLDETRTKPHQRERLTRIMHAAVTECGEYEVRRRLDAKYLLATPTVHHPDYQGVANSNLDRDIEVWEVRSALHDLNTRSAAGPDRVTNKVLKNLGESAIANLTDYYNRCWRAGTLPRQWKAAKTILIPKPGKPWQRYLEESGLYPDTVIGFRSKLGTQDAMIQLKREILDDNTRTRDNHTLQAAVDAIEEQLDGSGLVCSPSKSQLLVVPPKGVRKKKRDPRRDSEKIMIRTSGSQVIPHVEKIRVLGMLLERGRCNGETINHLTAKVNTAIRLIKRVSSRRAEGMKEASLTRLVQSFAVSHIAYVAAFHNWKIAEAQRTAQLERLSGTRTGRKVLRNLGLELRRADEETAEGAEVPECVRRHVQVCPIPKNVNPQYNRERRAARASSLIDLHARDSGAVYGDAAEYQDRRGAFAAAVVSAVTGETKAAASSNQQLDQQQLKDTMIRACIVLALATSAFAGYTGFGGYGLGYGLGYGGLGYAGYGLSHYGLAHGVGYSGLGLGYSYAPAAGVAVAAPAVAKTVSTYHAAPAVATVAHASPVATYAAAPVATYAAAPAVTSVVRSAPVVAAAPVATFAPAASYAVAAPAVTKTVSTYHAAPVATYAAAPAVTSVVRSAPVVAAAPVATYAAAPAVTRVATYHAAPVATAVAAPVATYAAAPAVAAIHAAPAVATTTVHAAPAVATVAHAAPVVASYGVAHAAPVYGYGVGHLGYGVGHYGFGHGLGAYGLNYGYGLGSPFDYTTLLRKKK
ncbi:uncharacterized protein LOC144146565 [Haemaphysalis longicornis]